MNIEKLTGVCVGLVEKLCACVQVSESSNAQTVGGVKLRLQELTTNLTNIHQLEETGCWQQNLQRGHTYKVNSKLDFIGGRTLLEGTDLGIQFLRHLTNSNMPKVFYGRAQLFTSQSQRFRNIW